MSSEEFIEHINCTAGCRLIRQTNPSDNGKVFGYHGPNIKYSYGVFTLEDWTKIKDGVGIRPNGEIYNTGNGEVLNWFIV